MNQICIAKKVSHNNVEFLDFAVNDQDQLLVFDTFKDASEFLKREVGTGEELLDYIITTVEAQNSNPRMQEVLSKGIQLVSKAENTPSVNTTPVQQPQPQSNSKNEFDCMFIISATDFEILNHEKIYDKRKNRVLIPVLAFVDESDPRQPVQLDNFQLASVFLGSNED